MTSPRAAFFGVLFLLVACGPKMQVTKFRDFPARPDNHPIMIFDRTKPTCAFDEVGRVTARRTNKLFISMDEVVATMQKHARKLGGDAILGLTESTQDRGGTTSADGVETKNIDAVFSGTVIRFRDPNCVE